MAGDDVDVGRLKMQGTGRIVGQVTEPDDRPNPSPWPFVRGEIYREACSGGPGRVEFITDEDGRFVVEDAPVGRVIVGVSYMATADMGGYIWAREPTNTATRSSSSAARI